MKALEQVLADWSERAATARYLRHDGDADTIENMVTDVREAAHEYLTWMNETQAHLVTGKAVPWLRSRFADWQRQGHARRGPKGREYRLVVLPRRADVEGARAAGRRAGEAAA